MAQRLAALVALLERSGSISSGESDAIFWLPWAPGTHMVHVHTRRQSTHTYKIKQNNLIGTQEEHSTVQNGG